MLERRLDVPAGLDLVRTLAPLRHGGGDPTTKLLAGRWWRSVNTPEGAGTVALERAGTGLLVRAWGAGASWLIDSAGPLVGGQDDWSDLDVESHPLLRELRRRHAGVRLCRSQLVLDSLVPAVLEQRVTGPEAWRAWRELVWRYGQPAIEVAGGPRLWTAPTPQRLLAVPSWDWHRFGVDLQRHRTVRAAATVADRLEECVALSAQGDYESSRRRLRLVPGVGDWTVAETVVRALGDPDAVSAGDFHLKNRVGFALTGAARSSDEQMLELLEPWRGQRARVVRLIELSGLTPPKYGPRFSPIDLRRS
jgi:3-methyladenine DNA glycosylase/8-oxoguanine DNA glycosylase